MVKLTRIINTYEKRKINCKSKNKNLSNKQVKYESTAS